jgi:uncharacterized protein (DUF983 family)
VTSDPSAPSPFVTGLKGCCPRCGKGPLFSGFLSVRPRCETCGLEFAFADSGDGPAFFVMSIVGIVVIALALWVEFAYELPIWLHMVMWSTLAIALSLAMVRPAKGLMVALQFHHKAEEGRLHR